MNHQAVQRALSYYRAGGFGVLVAWLAMTAQLAFMFISGFFTPERAQSVNVIAIRILSFGFYSGIAGLLGFVVMFLIIRA